MDTTQQLESFNELQSSMNDFLGGFRNTQTMAKETMANLLLTMGVPYFASRLKSRLPDNVYEKLQSFINDPENAGKELLSSAKDLFQSNVVEPLKSSVLGKLKQYVPELKDIDLEQATPDDIKNVLETGILNRVKKTLPAGIELPEDLTVDSAINAVKGMGVDQALAFAKKNLPADAYNALEQNKELIKDPNSIANYMQDQINTTRSQLSDTLNGLKTQAQEGLANVKSQLTDQLEQRLQPIKDKISQLSQAKDDLKGRYNTARQGLKDELAGLKERVNVFKDANPGYSQDDLTPFVQAKDDILKRSDDLFTKFSQDDMDIGQELNDNTAFLENAGSQLVSKIQGLTGAGINNIANVKSFVDENLNTIKQAATGIVPKVQDEMANIKNLVNTDDIMSSLRNPVIVNPIQRGKAFLTREETTQEPSFFDRFFNQAKSMRQGITQAQIMEQDPEASLGLRIASEAPLSENVPDIKPPEPEAPDVIGDIEKGVSSIGSKVSEGLDVAMAATEEVPVLDIAVDIAGLVGSIFGATSLMKSHETVPIQAGGSFEPNL